MLSILLDLKKDIRYAPLGYEKHSELIVVDFDLHKLAYANDNSVMGNLKHRLSTLAKELDFTLVSTPNGGFHAFFESEGTPFSSKSSQSRVTTILLNELDFLGGKSGVSCPNQRDRVILHLSESFKRKAIKTAEIPKVFLPISDSQSSDNDIFVRARGSNGYPLRKGHRRANCLYIWKHSPFLEEKDLLFINKYFCIPSKGEKEFQKEVLDKKPKPSDKQKVNFFIKSGLPNFIFD